MIHHQFFNTARLSEGRPQTSFSGKCTEARFVIFFCGPKHGLPAPVRFAAPVYAAVRHARFPSPVREMFYV